MKIDTDVDVAIKYPILQKLGIVPAVLLTSFFQQDSDDAAIADAPWDIVFFTSDGKDGFYENFQTSTRESLDKAIDASEIVPSKKNLPVVDLRAGRRDDDEIFLEDTVGPNLRRLIGKILDKNGVIFVNNIPDDYYEQLYQLVNDHKLKKSVYLLGKTKTDNRRVARWIENGFATVLPENNPELWSVYSSAKEYADGHQLAHLYIDGKIKSIQKSDIFKISQFGELLTVESAETNPSIEEGDIPSTFRSFLERSVGGRPDWYCYNSDLGFHLSRNVENIIFQNLHEALISADRNDNKKKPLLLYGQSFSGKTNVLCAVAQRIFAGHKYPVIYIPSMSIPADISEYSEDLAYLLKKIEEVANQDAENLHLVPTLIVWDTSCRQAGDLNVALKLLKALRSAGRQVQIICSSYKLTDQDGKQYWNQYTPLEISEKLEPNEQQALFEILRDKGDFTDEEIQFCTRRFSDNPHFIASLYQFAELHDEIQQHIDRESDSGNIALDKVLARVIAKGFERNFNNSLSILLDKALNNNATEISESPAQNEEFREKLKQVISCLALCTFYGCAMPIELVLRLLSCEFPNPSEIYTAFSNHTMLRELPSEDCELVIRSTLEAEIILDNQRLNSNMDCRINLLIKIMDNIDFSKDKEVELVRKLIQSFGPNCKLMDRTKYSLWTTERKRFRDILEKLKNLRESLPSYYANKLLPQELSLIREYYYSNSTASDDERAELVAARDIAQTALSSLTASERGSALEANITVEYCKLTKLLIDKLIISSSAQSVGELFRENRRRLLTLSQCSGDSYTQTTLLELGNFYYEYLRDAQEESQKLLVELFDYCLLFETSEDYSVQQEISKVYLNIDHFNMDDTLFKKSIREGNPTGIYIRAIQIKRKIDTLPGDESQEKKEKKRKYAQEILDEYLLNGQYKNIVRTDFRCINLLVRMLWMKKTGWEIIPQSGEERIKIKLSSNEWREIYQWCEAFDQCIDHPDNPQLRYLHAIAALHLDEYAMRAQTLLQGLYSQISRRGNWYLICDHQGNPSKFRGKFKYKNPSKRFGFLENVRSPMYLTPVSFDNVLFHPDNLGWTSRDCSPQNRGKGTRDFWISVSFSGLEVVCPDCEVK